MSNREPLRPHRFVRDHSSQSPPAKFTGRQQWTETPDADFYLDHEGGHHGHADVDAWEAGDDLGGEEFL